MKRPAFQFYPAQWTGNLKLRRCSEAARGAWVDIMCLLHDSEEYGVFRFPFTELVEAAKVKLKSARELVDKGVLKGGDRDVPSYIYTPRHAGKVLPQVTLLEASVGPIWYSSRMVRDEWLRGRRGEGTRFGPDNPPPIQRQGTRQGEPPTHRQGVDNSSPSRTPTARLGDGAAVASAVAVDTNHCFPGDSNSPASALPPTADGRDQPHNPDALSRILLECKRAKVEDLTDDNPVIARWIRNGATPTQVTKALTEARAPGAKPPPAELRIGYVDTILERVMRQDAEAAAATEARLKRTQAIIAQGIEAKAHAVPKPENFPAVKRA